MKRNLTLLSCLLVMSIFLACVGNSDQNSDEKRPKEGELATEFSPAPDTLASPVAEPTISPEDSLRQNGWEKDNMSNGAMPNCYNYKPGYGELNNKLIVTVGGGTDVVIKMMSMSTGRCVRYFFVNSGSTYSINNLPEDQYYLKIAYGKDWISKTEDGMCLGKFLSNALYEKGEDVLDFNKKITAKGYSIPSFSLELDVISNSSVDSFNSSNISEDDFNT